MSKAETHAALQVLESEWPWEVVKSINLFCYFGICSWKIFWIWFRWFFWIMAANAIAIKMIASRSNIVSDEGVHRKTWIEILISSWLLQWTSKILLFLRLAVSTGRNCSWNCSLWLNISFSSELYSTTTSTLSNSARFTNAGAWRAVEFVRLQPRTGSSPEASVLARIVPGLADCSSRLTMLQDLPNTW